jgi:alkanesulfonate monooxygenase
VAAIVDDMRARAAAHGRTLRFGYRAHVVVRETEAEARAAAAHLVAALDPEVGEAIRSRSLDSQSAGVRPPGIAARDAADDEGLRRAPPVDRHRAGPQRLRRGHRRRPRAGGGQAPRSYQALGIDTFILSGYPHLDECRRFSRARDAAAAQRSAAPQRVAWAR